MRSSTQEVLAGHLDREHVIAIRPAARPSGSSASVAPAAVVPYDRLAATRGRHRPGLRATQTARESAAPMESRTLTSLFESAERGDAAASEALFAALYGELHRVARRELGQRGGYVTLGVTTLLHEAYIKMSDRDGIAFPDRARFMAYAGRVMRTLIIDHVRNRRARKRGGLFEITALHTTIADQVADEQELQRISDALDELAQVDPALSEVVDLKFFCGFSFVEIAAMRSVSERTVQRQWEKARLYLYRALGDLAQMER
jgi:RNA polymerase sigma factor (TIGR02999 family)